MRALPASGWFVHLGAAPTTTIDALLREVDRAPLTPPGGPKIGG